MTLLIVLLVIVSGYGFLLKLENWMAKRMIRAKDIMILNLQQSNRMKDNKIDQLRYLIKRHRFYEHRVRKLSKKVINLSK